MAHDRQNAIRDMVDFDVRLKASETKPGHYHVEAELRAAEAEVFDEETGITLTVSTQRIMLRFEMEGLEVAPGQRHHDDMKTSGPTRKIVDKSEFRAGGSTTAAATGKLSVAGPEGQIEGTIKGEAAVATSRTVEATFSVSAICIAAETHESRRELCAGGWSQYGRLERRSRGRRQVWWQRLDTGE